MPNSQLMSILKGHTDLINSVAVHPWRQMFASVGKDQTVRLWLKESADSRMKGCIPVSQDWDAP
jgi:WD40 repeat protein